MSANKDGSTAMSRSRLTSWNSRMAPLCIHSHRPCRNGWQLERCTGVPVDARMWANSSGVRIRPGDLPQVLVVPGGVDTLEDGRSVAVAVAVPADPEPVAVRRGGAETGVQALVDDRVLRAEQQVLGEDRVSGVSHPSAHGLSESGREARGNNIDVPEGTDRRARHAHRHRPVDAATAPVFCLLSRGNLHSTIGDLQRYDPEGGIGMTDLLTRWRALPLMWSEALRALVCLLPMVVATALDRTTYLVTLGQGAFFYSSIFLPRKFGGRFVMGSLVVALGLGFYLIGGTVAPYPLVAVLFTFFVCLNLSFISAWTVGGPLALTLVMIYTAGLNTGSPEKASANFLVFAFVMGWSAIISLLPFWTPVPPPPVNERPAHRGTCRAGSSDGHRHRRGPGHLLFCRIRQDRLGPQRRRQCRAV